MNDLKLADITTKCFILALFVRDDGERFLLGTGAYEFKQSQQHFAANSMSNDVVSVQGNDGYLLAGQVRRPNPQVFDGYIGDASVIKSQIEGMRRNFFEFFQKNHFYTVIYVFPDGSAIQRRRGFIVDSPEVKELYQVFPEYHVALNFEDTNYYKYAETSDGEEAYTKSANVGLSTVATGGLVWAGIETVILTGEGTSFNLSGTIDGEVLQSAQLKGDTEQTTYTGKNLCPTTTENLYLVANTGTAGKISGNSGVSIAVEQNTDYTVSVQSSQVRYRVGFVDTIPQNDYDTVTAYNGANGDGTSNTLTVNSGSHNYLIVNVTDLTACQVEKGSTATSFEPYVGGVASPNPDYPQEVQTITGLQTVTISDGGSESQRYEIYLGTGNLLDPNTVVTGTIQADGSINTGATTYATTDYIEIDPTRVITKTATGSPRVKLYDASKNLISTAQYNDITDFNNAGDFQVPYSNAKYIRFTIYTTDYPVANVEVKQPTIELCKIGTYQDYIYRQNGDWYLHKEIGKYTILESDIAQGADYTNVYFASFPKQTDDLAYGAYPNAPTMVMDIATFQAYSSSWNRDIYVGKFVASATGNRYWVGFTAGTTLASAKEKMAGGVIYYALATPTDTQITDEGLLEQLEALAEATTYDRLTIFSVASENLPATLAASVEATTQGGVEWDEYGAVFEEGSTGGATTIAVDSITEVLPVWTVKGPANNPTIQNLTTGTSMSFSGNVTASQTLKVDMLNQTATLNGTSVIGRMSGDWIELAPGNNRMYYSTGNSDAPDSSLEWQEVVG